MITQGPGAGAAGPVCRMRAAIECVTHSWEEAANPSCSVPPVLSLLGAQLPPPLSLTFVSARDCSAGQNTQRAPSFCPDSARCLKQQMTHSGLSQGQGHQASFVEGLTVSSINDSNERSPCCLQGSSLMSVKETTTLEPWSSQAPEWHNLFLSSTRFLEDHPEVFASEIWP